MKIRQIKIILTLAACIIVVIFSILQEYSLKELSYTLVIVAILFYLIGALIQGMVNRGMRKQMIGEKITLDDSSNDEQIDLDNSLIEKD